MTTKTLIGTYAAGYTLAASYSSDGHGGTKVVDPAKAAAPPPHMLPLIAAMAEFGGGGAAEACTPPGTRQTLTTWLARPA